MKKLKAGIIGVSGYTGFVLLKILRAHPAFELAYLATSNGGEELSALFPKLHSLLDLPIQKADAKKAAKICDVVFLALPHGSSFLFVKELVAANPKLKIIDLSADYRLNLENYEKNYCKHLDAKNIKNAIYGLPEFNAKNIKNATLIANPGCYPTASLLALLPFANMLESNIFIDAKSGVSGAGKKLTDNTHYPFINENIFAYSPITHRHAVEIFEKTCEFGGQNLNSLNISFVPHLTPLNQGMLVSVFGVLKKEFAKIKPLEVLKNFYKNAQFVRVKNAPVSVANVFESNFCDIFALNNNGALFINSAIDNLWRGASSQAIANANLACGFEESTGLI